VNQSQLFEILKMGRTVGTAALRAKYPDATPDQLASLDGAWKHKEAKASANDQPEVQPTYGDPHRRMFMTVAWLLGASYRQLGRMYQVAPQTIMQHLDREMPTIPDRAAVRIIPPPMQPEKLTALHELFYKMVAVDTVRPFYTGLDAIAIARSLASFKLEATSDDAIDSAYADLPVKEHQ
jgi:hypothetical protein